MPLVRHRGEQAAELYTRVFPNSAVNEISRAGPEGPREEGSVMTWRSRWPGRTTSPLNGGPDFHFSEAISFQIDCTSQDEVDQLGGAVRGRGGEPVRLKDRFGLSWQVVPRRLTEPLG